VAGLYSAHVTEQPVPVVLVVADPEDVGELTKLLAEPLPTAVSKVDVVATHGGDDTIDVFEAKKPPVVVTCATLAAGDTASLIEALRGMAPATELAIVVIGDREGAQSIATGVAELRPDGFVNRPIVGRALRFEVANALERVLKTRGTIPTTTGTAPGTDPGDREEVVKAAQRARWEALADSLVEPEPVPDESVEAAPLPPQPPSDQRYVRSLGGPTHDMQFESPPREPTLIIPDPPSTESDSVTSPSEPVRQRPETSPPPPDMPRTRTGDEHVPMIERASNGQWSDPMPLAALVDRDSKDRLEEEITKTRNASRNSDSDVLANVEISDEIPLDDFDDDLVIGDDIGTMRRPAVEARIEVFDDSGAVPVRDFARQLRAKMSQMAQRLFQGGDAAQSGPVDLGPRHDHHTEIDLTSLGEETPLAATTEIEARAAQRVMNEVRGPATSPGSWDTHVRERGLPDAGEIVRGVSDAAVLLARMFATGATGRVTFKRMIGGVEPPPSNSALTTLPREVEKVVLFDQGRPVFASSSETRDRMGELLVREGKITASQYERCQAVVAESGRRMGEILVDLGYLKRRELLPAVRRHVEDIVYSLFGWDRGQYAITLDATPSAERIRLSRHPAALVLEGIRRKLDRSTLERLLGPPSTIIEVADRDRLNSIINTGNTGDLVQEERAALAAIDGQADLAQVARTAGVDLADVLPLAWGLCTLGLASARRTETEVPDESVALVGETDMVIDRERVRARWQLVTEADYFALLGVRRDATAFEIRRAYQSARRDFAPETFPPDLRRELAQELDDIGSVLDEAFRVLRDDRLRGTYLSNLVE
jgi:CheY-like chemotaxis protein